MRVVIIGAGSVGYVAAETIAGVHDVLVLDNDFDKTDKVTSSLNVSVLHEDGSNPRALRAAIQRHNAEAVVSTLGDDAVNLFICMMAKRYDPRIMTIATVNNPDFRIELESEGYVGVDKIISPEMVTARKIYKMAVMENATDFEFVESLGVGVAVFRVTSGNTVAGKAILDFRLPEECSVFGIYREGKLLLDVETMEAHVGDGICVFGSEKGLSAFNDYMGVELKAVQFVILGGSIMGSNLAKMLLSDKEKRFVTIVEINENRCRELSRFIPEAMVLREDYRDPMVQRSEQLFKSDCIVVASGSDDTNLLMSMTAEKNNSRKVITRYFKPEYKDIFSYTGLNTTVGFYRIVSNEITDCVLPNDVALMRLRNYNELFFMYSVKKKSRFCDRYLGDVKLPAGIRVVAVSRDDYGSRRIIYSDLDTYVKEGDQLIVFTTLTREADFKDLFGKNVISER